MARFTIQEAAKTARRFHSLRVHAVIDARAGAGFVLTDRLDSSGVLGIGCVDVTGEYAAIGLDRDEATALRDALSAWLDGA